MHRRKKDNLIFANEINDPELTLMNNWPWTSLHFKAWKFTIVQFSKILRILCTNVMRGQQKGANGLTHHIIFTLKLHSGLEIRFVFDIISYNPQCLHTIVGPRSQHIFIYVHTIVWIRPSSVFCRSDIKICPEKVYAHVNGQQFPQLMHILEFEYKFSQYDLYDFGFYSFLLLDYCTFSCYNITKYNDYVIFILFLTFNICWKY